ncbi:p43 [Euproctis pseudoconspersa nucleopolyhedrovirus]|uniref:p43 n=1 Tax=Euproctis pseudoconspersa nucleopolyhedrovirus TaxID=307467 RepID=C3TX32_9ABAC|nr:p43 [Euproctis pseudoconspersa nucleopolyhedrovirus]ACO53574.1 p43 [Euproctis pseudoconspersa nucleopolyhedrovirus]
MLRRIFGTEYVSTDGIYNFDDDRRKLRGLLFNAMFSERLRKRRDQWGLRKILPRAAKSHVGFLFYHIPVVDQEERLAKIRVNRKRQILKNYYQLLNNKRCSNIVIEDFKRIALKPRVRYNSSRAKQYLTAFIDLCLPNKRFRTPNMCAILEMIEFYDALRLNKDDVSSGVFKWMALIEEQHSSYAQLIYVIAFRVLTRLTYSKLSYHEINAFVVKISDILIKITKHKSTSEQLVKMWHLIFKSYVECGNRKPANYKINMYRSVFWYLYLNFYKLLKTDASLIIEVGFLAKKYQLYDLLAMYESSLKSLVQQTKTCLSLRDSALSQHLLSMGPIHKMSKDYAISFNFDYDFDFNKIVRSAQQIYKISSSDHSRDKLKSYKYKYSGWNSSSLNYQYFYNDDIIKNNLYYIMTDKNDKKYSYLYRIV